MITTDAHTLSRPGAVISYLRVGEGPALLLLHATLSAAQDMRALARRLGPRFTVFSVDRRGSGRSRLLDEARTGPIDVATHVADLLDLIEREGVAPVTLVGHSYGGCLALELAARHPQAVSSCFVWEPPYAPVGSDAIRERLVDVGRRTTEAGAAEGPGAAAEAFLQGVAGTETVRALGSEARERVRSQGAAALADATLLGLDPVGLGRIEAPVMVVTGSDSHPDYAAIAGALIARIPGAAHETIEGMDHMAPITRPDAVAAAVRAFVAP